MEQIARLVDRLGPSRSSVDRIPWEVVERGLGIELPKDYKAWGDLYPSISLGDSVEISNYSCAEEGVRAEVERRLTALRNVMQHNGVYKVFNERGKVLEADVPAWDTYPLSPGLLGWGSIVGGIEISWFTDGAPDDWKVVLADDVDCLHVFDCGFTEFILRFLDDNLSPELSTVDWLTTVPVKEMWGYKTVSIQGIDYRAIDFRPI